MYLNVILTLVGGLGIFLYGMDHMSTGMRKLAGPKLKKLLAVLTTNRFMAIIVGIFITAMVQSSSVSTVMTIGFVNASLLSLQQGLAIILGANIGTTVTGWLLALKLGIYGLPIVGAAAIFYMFSKKEKHKTIATALMGFGFIFFGLELMSNGLKPIRELPEFIRFFHYFKADSYIGIIKASLVGAMFTAVVQSSAATLGITITLAQQGLIDYPTAVALVLGENVGTTITALLASIGATANAKRASYAHTLINLFGVLWVTALFRPYIYVLDKLSDPGNSIAQSIATAHTMFNILNVLLFIPFIGPLAKLLCYIVKDKSIKEIRVTKLNEMMLKVPSVVADQTQIEVLSMAEYIEDSFQKLDTSLNDSNTISTNAEKIKEAEDILDKYEKEISDINFELLHKEIEGSLVDKTRGNLIVCDEFETISDYINRISKELHSLISDDLTLTEKTKNVLLTMNSMTSDFFITIKNAYIKKEKELFVQAIRSYEEIKFVYKEAKIEHFSSEEENMPSRLSSGYSDILHYYRRVSDHIYNIIEFYAQI